MSFMLVCEKPGRGAYVYQLGAGSLAEASATGKELAEANPGQWGRFLYARSSFRAPITLDTFYLLQPSPVYLRYRKDWEEVNAPFDYINYSGGALRFNLEWQDTVSKGTVRLCAVFDAGRSFKFVDLCKTYLAKFILRDGTPVLQFFNRMNYALEGEIVLKSEH